MGGYGVRISIERICERGFRVNDMWPMQTGLVYTPWCHDISVTLCSPAFGDLREEEAYGARHVLGCTVLLEVFFFFKESNLCVFF